MAAFRRHLAWQAGTNRRKLERGFTAYFLDLPLRKLLPRATAPLYSRHARDHADANETRSKLPSHQLSVQAC